MKELGKGVGLGVGAGLGDGVGSSVGAGVGNGVGPGVGSGVGARVGDGVGARVGLGVGVRVGDGVGARVGLVVGAPVGNGVSAGVGSTDVPVVSVVGFDVAGGVGAVENVVGGCGDGVITATGDLDGCLDATKPETLGGFDPDGLVAAAEVCAPITLVANSATSSEATAKANNKRQITWLVRLEQLTPATIQQALSLLSCCARRSWI